LPVRVGFVGVGGRAGEEMRDLLDIEDVSLAAFCDVAPGRCEEALAACNRWLQERGKPPLQLPFFRDVREMLGSVELDAVYVSVPTFAHGAIEHAILDAGLHLFVEKPIAIDMSVAREVADHARRAGVVTCVGYQLRYASTTLRARELLRDRVVGLATALRFGGLPGAPWWRVQRQSGGMLIEQHTHAVDLLRFLMGEVARVYAEADTRLLTDVPDLDIADVNVATLRFASGAVGTLANSPALVHGLSLPGVLSHIHVIARGLTLSLAAGSRLAVTREGGGREEWAVDNAFNRDLNLAFIHAVRTGDRSRILSPYEDALRSFEVTYACQLSAERRQVVELGRGY
jgi:myo-inositol 2-dehydrogenase/D-chiro-inositol 1-dehydrogenase